MKNNNNNQLFLKKVKIIAQNSTCIRKQVGAIAVKDNRIIAMAYNGVVSKAKHCNKIFKKSNITSLKFLNRHKSFSNNNELHAEQNLIAFMAKNNINSNKCVIYLTLSPCIHCAKLLFAAGIKKIIYIEKYDRDINGILFLKKNRIKVIQYNE